jgi:hypothetical protein
VAYFSSSRYRSLGHIGNARRVFGLHGNGYSSSTAGWLSIPEKVLIGAPIKRPRTGSRVTNARPGLDPCRKATVDGRLGADEGDGSVIRDATKSG